MSRSETRFAVSSNHLQMTGVGLSYCAYTSGVSLGFREASFVRQIFNIDGTGRYATGNQSGEIRHGLWSPVLASGRTLRLELRAGYRQLVLRLELDALKRNLSALIGEEVSELAFDETEARQPALSSLRRRIFQFASDFNERGTYFSALAAAEVERMVIMKFLMCHRHNYTHLLLREPLPSTSSAVKTVEQFIEANWDRPIDVPSMARVARVSARSLFRQFRAGSRLFAGGFCQAGPARSCARISGSTFARLVGHADRAPMRLPESRSLRARFPARLRRAAIRDLEESNAAARSLTRQRPADHQHSTRLEPSVSAASRRGIGGEPLDQFDHFRALRRRKPDECFQEPQALDRFAGWTSERLPQFRNRCAIFHLAPFRGKIEAGCPVESMPRNNPTGKEFRYPFSGIWRKNLALIGVCDQICTLWSDIRPAAGPSRRSRIAAETETVTL